MGEQTVIRGSCHHDCPDTCVWDVTVEDGRAVRLRGNADHPTTRGQLCPKVNRFLDRVHHPERVLTPLRRTGPKGSGAFEPVPWDEALRLVGDGLRSAIAESGPASILQFSFDGTQGAIQKGLMADRFFDALGASDIGRDLCGVTAWLGAADVSGLPYGIDPEDLRHTRNIVLWGTNTHLTNRHLWPVIEEARAAGAVVTVVDPIRTSTAEKADDHLQLRPGTDVALVLAMIHVADRDGLLDDEWLAEHTSGGTELLADARAMTPADAAIITGLAVERIEAFARAYVERRPSAIRVLVGPEHREHGREIMRAIALLPAVTGTWRDVGGGLARSTQVYFETALAYPEHRPERRTINMALVGAALTDGSLDPPIRSLVVHNSNPAVICPDQNRVMAGLQRDDLFTVVVEQFLTDTALHADVVLPATSQIEHLDLGIAWGHLYLALNRPAIEPLGEALPNTEIFRRLSAELGLDAPGLRDSDEELVRQLLDSDHPWLAGITYERLWDETWVRLAVPDGHRPNVDLAPQTPDARLQLGSLRYAAGAESPDGDPELASRYPLALISRKQHAKFLNANYGGFDAHLPAEGEPRLQMHPTDAAARSIGEGDRVVVRNDRGSLTLTATLTDVVGAGVVAVPFGWWNRHSPDERGVNALTNPTPNGERGSAAFHDTLVEVALA
ncbi:MAG: molybdopterin-dependent oxidoreductase [Actinomycetota bacterium]